MHHPRGNFFAAGHHGSPKKVLLVSSRERLLARALRVAQLLLRQIARPPDYFAANVYDPAARKIVEVEPPDEHHVCSLFLVAA
jgi:hypothetical protein